MVNMNNADELTGIFYKGKNLTRKEYEDLLAQAAANGQEVVHRTELGKLRKPRRRREDIGWITVPA